MAFPGRDLIANLFVVIIMLTVSPLAHSADEPGPKTLEYTKARQLAQASPGHGNLHKIGLALHGYHDLFNHFPPAVLTGPDGETKYSWRVELLPVLKYYVNGVKPDRLREMIAIADDQRRREFYQELIQESGYRLDEPWDSAHNETLLKSGPDVYRHPSDAPDSIYARYFAVTGSGAAFDGDKGLGLAAFVDGASKTVMLVEARQDIPWTLPEDLVFAADKPLPGLGGFSQDGSLIMTCDGAVHFLPQGVAEQDVRALVTRKGEDSFSLPWIPYRYKNN